MGKFAKPIRPRMATAHPLWRQCIFAVAAGWDKGAAVTPTATMESIRKQRGVPVTTTGIYTKQSFGWALAAGTAVDVTRWADTGNRYDISDTSTFAMTVAALVRSNVNSVTDDGQVIARRAATGTGNAGWALQMRNTLGDPWAFEVCDGAGGENRAQATTEPDTLTDYMVVGRVSLTTGLIEIFVNGRREASTATTIASVPNTNEPITLFGYNDNASATMWDGNVGMAAVWKRWLSNNEILRLYSDPFMMWKRQHAEFTLGPGEGAGQVPGFFLAF